jgi:osmoprotectant transport system ATP-binding protein
MIEVRGVSKTYDDGTRAVDLIDLTIETGSLTVFVGPSGCGKTTTMRMINRMVEPTTGTVLVDGEDIRGIPPATLRKSMGYVLQGAGLFPHRTAVDNVATTLRLAGVPRRQARTRAQETLRLVRLRPELDERYPAQLSGGQQQRVGVARALAADPPILLMDEPFSAVDPVVRAELQQELLRLRETLSQTIVFVTHDIDEALLLGDRIVVFGPGGAIHQHADPQSLLERPADPFVAQMVGRDRGFRSLGFRTADLDILPLERTDAQRTDEQRASDDSAPSVPVPGGDPGWSLELDADGRPAAWLSTQERIPAGEGWPAGGGLRQALDAVLSSPTAAAPAVDETGTVIGWITRSAVLAAVDGIRDRS